MDAQIAEKRNVTAEGVRMAADRLSGVAMKTPLLESPWLNQELEGRVFIKAEVLQLGGSFKLRGAYNLIAKLEPAVRSRGVVAWSSGNHAQGIALAARMFDCPAVIIMPQDAPQIKIEMVRSYGAEIVFYDRYAEDREKIGVAIAAERDMALAPSYDHPDIIEGQGTVGLEIASQAAAFGAAVDAVVICCGGGGLTAGCAIALRDVSPATQIWIAEPEGFDESRRSIETGERQNADVTQRTICDAIATPTPGRLTLPVMQELVAGGLTVTEDEVRAAMRFSMKHLKLIVEPGGAVALAAVLSGKIPVRGRTVAVTLSGGNADPDMITSILAD
ncbi:MAG: threonine/serine dehydratase [Pseudomonadota bacterium]